MTDFNLKFIIPAILTVLLMSVKIASAGSCVIPSLDSSIKDSAYVTVLKLKSVEKYVKGQKERPAEDIKQLRFTVEKIYKGKLKIGQTLVFGDPDITYEGRGFSVDLIGKSFLFYLDKKSFNQGKWNINSCSRSDLAENAVADLFYLNKMDQVAGKSRLSGTVAQEIKSAVEGEETIFHRLDGRNITISGNGRNITVKTDSNGIYEVYDLPAGHYRVTSERIAGYKFNQENTDFDEIFVEPEGLSDLDFVYKIDDSVSGKFFDPDGKPFKGVYMNLIPADGQRSRNFYGGAVTDQNGAFIFTEIPAGTYFLVVNNLNQVTSAQPFSKFYYPNKVNQTEAVKISITPGRHLTDLMVSAPSMAETVQIKGVLLFKDGKPAAHEKINFFNGVSDISEIKALMADSTAYTNQEGKFEIKILKDQKGILYGVMNVSAGKHKKCSQADSLISVKRDKDSGIKSSPIQLAAGNNLNNIVVKFPFPRCEEIDTD